MDTSLVIMFLIVMGSIFIPYFFFTSAGQSEGKKIETKIKQAISENNLTISESESWCGRYLGIDTIQRKVLFLKIAQSENQIHLLDLNTIKECKILERRKVLKIKDKKEKTLENLDLEVTLNNRDILLLNFYDDQDLKENFELRRIEKWKSIVIDLTLVMPLVKKTA